MAAVAMPLRENFYEREGGRKYPPADASERAQGWESSSLGYLGVQDLSETRSL
jgi:hypothetical protein